MVEFRGIGEAWYETGLEGIAWCLLKNASEGDASFEYENLIPLEDGDELTVFDRGGEKVLWHGTVSFERESHKQTNAYGYTGQAIRGMWCHGIQKTDDPDTFHGYFFDNHPMTLRRPEKS